MVTAIQGRTINWNCSNPGHLVDASMATTLDISVLCCCLRNVFEIVSRPASMVNYEM